MSVNLAAPHVLTEALQDCLAADSTVVFLSSVAAARATPGTELYGATKAGVEALVRGFGYRLGARGIRVVGIAPGLVDTPMAAAALYDSEHTGQIARSTLTGRIATAEDLADLVLCAPVYDERGRPLPGFAR